MGPERKKNSELRWQAAETRQAAADREEHGLFILFEPGAEDEPPEDEPLARDDTTK
jgi:hypothetical protein